MATAYASDVPEDIINIFNSDSDNEFLGFNSDDEEHVLATVNAISTETNSDIEIDSDVSDDDDDDLADNFDTGTAFTEPVWSNNLDENIRFNTFTGENVGPTHNLDFLSSELSFFQLLFHDDFIHEIL